MDEPLVALPIRSFRDAYQRLAGSHGPDERAALARALASHTAGTVLQAGVTPHIVTSATEVREWALGAGYRVAADPPDGGLDGAAAEAVRLAAGRPWLILHADLPCLDTDEVELALGLARSGERVLAPSYDGGTSALGGRGRFPFRYGVASFHRHLATGRPPRVIASLGFLLDIDRPHDLVVAARHPRGAWLAESVVPGTH
ncbi:2-phospho-L-lactate guanylyltransferase [Candidatus Spongiisocius sp.]|uniref:2-phospho-L-lactate guanylyltransferase n=1 Tax=Candidatus Spongiisocius sp. TaxID=3101273 RepID=UPI003B5BBCE3